MEKYTWSLQDMLCKLNNKYFKIFECDNIVQIMHTVSLIRIFSEHNKKILSINSLFSNDAYMIYKYKRYCRPSSLSETNNNVLNHVKSSFLLFVF